ncbi:MAG: potassium transporter TrkG, partial [Oceanisphaera sp.]|nr:potassium transporter TrkG [Oceanisphaera sp.]
AWNRRSIIGYFQDSEVKLYLLILTTAGAITTGFLYMTQYFDSFGADLHHGLFQAVSIGTTTGFTTAAYHTWPGFLPVMLLFLSFIGGCAGSTAGGMKVIRFLLLIKQGLREITRLVHPNATVVVKVGKSPMPDRVLEAVWGFFAAYVGVFVVMMLLLMASGLDQITAFSAVAASLNNLGPGLGDVGNNYATLNDFSKWVLTFAMLLGRLEIFPMLILLSPVFWRR